jgi:uncharacterized membrane-anchored protein
MTWLGENWYILTGFGGGLVVLMFYLYAHRHPDGAVMVLWKRAYYTVAAAAVFGAIALLVAAVFFPTSVSWVLSPVAPFVLMAAMWFVAPYLQRWIPLERRRS